MTALPARNILDGSAAPLTSEMKTAMGSLRDYLAGLLGASGDSVTSFKNKIINGLFLINQRGVSGTVVLAPGAYGHDRWKAGSSGCTYTFSVVNNVVVLTITSGSLMQVIEGINLQSGTYVLSWDGTSKGRIDSCDQGDSGITGVAVGGTNQAVEFGLGTLSKVQYEPGTSRTPLEVRLYPLELMACQRYYEVGKSSFECALSAGGYRQCREKYRVEKRVAVTPTILSSNFSPTVDDGTTSSFRAYNSTGNGFELTWAAYAEI